VLPLSILLKVGRWLDDPTFIRSNGTEYPLQVLKKVSL
jgi:hypothetical protein